MGVSSVEIQWFILESTKSIINFFFQSKKNKKIIIFVFNHSEFNIEHDLNWTGILV